MPISLTNEMMRAIIMDHSSNPTNKHTPSGDGYEKVHMHSDNCIDDIEIHVLIENGIIKDCCFTGIGCTITTASTDIMCDLVLGKSEEEAQKIINNYFSMIHEENYDEEVLQEANAFMNTSKQAARIRCATIGWNGLQEILKNGQ